MANAAMSKKRCGREPEQLSAKVTQQTRQRGSSFQQQYHMMLVSPENHAQQANSLPARTSRTARQTSENNEKSQQLLTSTTERVKRADPQRVRTRQIQRDDELSTETARCFSGKQSPDQKFGSETVENKILHSTMQDGRGQEDDLIYVAENSNQDEHEDAKEDCRGSQVHDIDKIVSSRCAETEEGLERPKKMSPWQCRSRYQPRPADCPQDCGSAQGTVHR